MLLVPWNFRALIGVGVHSKVNEKEDEMLNWAFIFLVLALVAGVLGFGGIAAASAEIAKIVFFVFLILFAISAVAHAIRGSAPSA